MYVHLSGQIGVNMNILLVDDEPDVLEGILDGIDFNLLGFNIIYTATNSTQAKEILLHQKIDIMLTDIEMPGESGLELLQWVRDQKELDVITLFCTSFANFDYAQKAVELHSFGYFLKPIFYTDLQEKIRKATLELQKKAVLNLHIIESIQTQKNIFWKNYLEERAPNSSSVPTVAYEDFFDYSSESKFILCALKLVNQSNSSPLQNRKAFQDISLNLATSRITIPETILFIRSDIWCFIFSQSSISDIKTQFDYLGKELQKTCFSFKDFAINCYIESNCTLANINDNYHRLIIYVEDDVFHQNEIFYNVGASSDALPEDFSALYEEWELFLSSGKIEIVFQKIEQFIQKLISNQILNLHLLKEFQLSIIQILYTVLNQRGVSAKDLFATNEYEKLYSASLYSANDFLIFIKYSLQKASDYFVTSGNSSEIVLRVKKYIDEHYNEELNRSEIAKTIFLNPDYLATLFKKETGYSLTTYLTQQRITIAKRLLLQTKMPVYEIAQHAGYNNFSYFSQIFRKATGQTPNEYRKQNT